MRYGGRTHHDLKWKDREARDSLDTEHERRAAILNNNLRNSNLETRAIVSDERTTPSVDGFTNLDYRKGTIIKFGLTAKICFYLSNICARLIHVHRGSRPVPWR
jgi:hypothetical protein